MMVLMAPNHSKIDDGPLAILAENGGAKSNLVDDESPFVAAMLDQRIHEPMLGLELKDKHPMRRFAQTGAMMAVVMAAGSLGSGTVEAQVRYGTPYRGSDGYTYRMDTNYCVERATQRGWIRQGCMSAAQARAHNDAIVRQLQAIVAQQRAAQQAAAAQRRANGTCIAGDPGCVSIQHPDASNYPKWEMPYGGNGQTPCPNCAQTWAQGVPQYRR
jgi:hypothetical protein